VKIGKAGVLIGGEIGMVVSRGYQMFLRTPAGHEIPALATHLHALHDFDEDLSRGWVDQPVQFIARNHIGRTSLRSRGGSRRKLRTSIPGDLESVWIGGTRSL